MFNTALKTCSGGACLDTLRGCAGAAGDTDDLVTALKYVPCVSELVDCVLNLRYLLGREMCLHLNVTCLTVALSVVNDKPTFSVHYEFA